MKKIALLTTLCICFSLFSKAQINKGSLFIGGSFGGFSNSVKDDAFPNYESTNSGFSIFPQIGKAIATNKIVGLSVGYGKSTSESNFNNQKQENSGYSASIFYRRYYALSTRFYLFGQADLGWSQNKQRREENDVLLQTATNNNVDFSITPGISFAASPRVHLEASLNSLVAVGYGFGKGKNYAPLGGVTGTSTQKNFYLSGNANGFSTITVGVRFIIPKK